MTLTARFEDFSVMLARFLWGAALFTLPVTSFRYFPGMGEGTLVRPLSFYPVALLGLVLIFQFYRDKTSIPRTGVWIPLIVFVLLMLAASSYGALLNPLTLRGQDYFGRVIRAWVTVVIGFSFFIASVWMNRNEEDLRFTLRWLLAGFVMDVAWSSIQALAFYTPLLPKVTVTHWQRAFSMRELVRSNRISGMAYEPAWLAGQITTIYMPWLLAALLTRIRVTRFKWFEPALFGGALLLLLATYSRGGLLAALIALTVTFLFAGRAEIRAGRNWFVSGFQRGRDLILRLGIIVLVLAAITGSGLFLSRKGYITRLFNSNAENLQEFIIENSAGARAAYIFGALGAYEESPWLGVGLGASGFYIFGQGGLNAGYYKQESDAPDNAYDDEVNRTSIGINAFPGISFAISKSFHLETGFNNLVSLYYFDEERDDNSPNITGYSSNGFGFSSSLSNATSSFYLGFRVVSSK